MLKICLAIQALFLGEIGGGGGDGGASLGSNTDFRLSEPSRKQKQLMIVIVKGCQSYIISSSRILQQKQVISRYQKVKISGIFFTL